ncbi:putative two-component system response regulator [Actinoplanes missouriensis 431]|uniref:Transcriptional regulatory protein n=1 Tax=Actinoplanes missouriensis (strain ATCC 14538 / DSM 43046 / CBS 188.64 / JCM 3121 / NBRC 102363 / NCIMB 12654 / NRRL B-3342 / UNCC 431) TaxID=512565 RepID=I0HDI2_ACTM4|nr:response regulator [Actinoplanes missouriensis]BAL91069.1 putative two-component system response regulator [Actinoplanes missouriensis 431]
MIRVLVVDDEPRIAEAHRAYTEKVVGFGVAGVAHTAAEAMARLRGEPIDLVLLDLNLPDKHGLEIARALRAAGSGTDVLAVTSNRDIDMIRQAVALGVTHYLLKPFTFAAFRDKLDGYARYRRQLREAGAVAAQHEVDRVFATLRGSSPDTLPKGLDQRTFDLIRGALRAAAPAGLSAAEVAARIGTSRVTARRYLEHLADAARVTRAPRYGGPGRPEVEYRPGPAGIGSP